MRQRKLTKKAVLAILRDVTFPTRTWLLTTKGDGWMPQVTYYEDDIDTGKLELQKSRKHYISPFSTETEVVDTCFLCITRSFEHVVREHFLYKERRVQSPHFSMNARIEMCDREMYDKRKPIPLKASAR